MKWFQKVKAWFKSEEETLKTEEQATIGPEQKPKTQIEYYEDVIESKIDYLKEKIAHHIEEAKQMNPGVKKTRLLKEVEQLHQEVSELQEDKQTLSSMKEYQEKIQKKITYLEEKVSYDTGDMKAMNPGHKMNAKVKQIKETALALAETKKFPNQAVDLLQTPKDYSTHVYIARVSSQAQNKEVDAKISSYTKKVIEKERLPLSETVQKIISEKKNFQNADRLVKNFLARNNLVEKQVAASKDLER
jgi:hypothetical protein